MALEPSRGPKIGHGSQEKTKINWGNRLESISGVLEPFKCLYRAPKPIVLHWIYSASRILCHILTFSDPSSQPGQTIFLQNDLKRCPTYSTTCFMLNSHLDLDLFWPFRAIYSRYIILTKSSFKVWSMDDSWNFFPFSQSLHINEPPQTNLAPLARSFRGRKNQFLQIIAVF